MKKWILSALIGVCALGGPALGCGVEMTVGEMADHAAQVIVAEVESARSYWADEPRRIETELVLRDVEYLKGGYEGAAGRRTLIVPGGTVGEWGMRLCCAPEYKAGERWVLFLLPTCKVHPVVGMERGSLRVVRGEDGVERVRGAGGRAVTAIDADGMVRMASGGHRHGVEAKSQRGVRIVTDDRGDEAEAGDEAMTLGAFRGAIAPALARSRDHGLREDAGRRVEADHRAVPIKRAGEAKP